MTSSTTSTEQSGRQPLLTLKSFLVSAGIIAVVFLVVTGVRSFVTPEQDEETETYRIASGDQEYEYTVIDGDSDADQSILAVPISGIILTEPIGDMGFAPFLGETGITYGYQIKEQLKRAARVPEISAVILEINSPGGTVGGAQAISDGIEQYRESTGNPVYAHITDTGASGAYWAAAATDLIAAEQGAIIGSIGVIMGPFRFYDGVTAEGSLFGGVNTDGGIEYQFFTGGEFKDTGSPYRPMTEEEEEHWQEAISAEYDVFVEHVSTSRELTEDFIREEVRALPYNVQQARSLDLIDAIGSRDATINELATAAGFEEGTAFNIIIEEEAYLGFLDELFSETRLLINSGNAAGAPAGPETCSWCFRPLYLYDGSYQLTTAGLE